jgi:hypothetical protein
MLAGHPHLSNRNEFVWPVRERDIAGAKEHTLHTQTTEMSAVTAIGHANVLLLGDKRAARYLNFTASMGTHWGVVVVYIKRPLERPIGKR